MSNQVTTDPVENLTPQPPPELIWSHLLDKFFEVLQEEGKGKQKANFKSAFKFFLISIGLTEESSVGQELGDEFEAKIDLFIKFQVGRGLSESTYKPRVSKIKELKSFAEENFAASLRLQTLPQPFGPKLRKLIASTGLTIVRFWKTLPTGLVSYDTLRYWCLGHQYPSKKYIVAIKTIETALGVPAGTLLLSKYLCGVHHQIAGQSDFGNKVKAAISKPYGIWTASLQEEFQKLLTHKTEAILPEDEERHDDGQWTSSEGAGVPTAKIVKQFLREFMGFCSLPADNPDPYLRGRGISPEELSLALLADKELVEAYLKFMRLRSGLRVRRIEESEAATLPAYLISADGKWEYYDKGGKYNKGSLLALMHTSSLLRPGTGYLYQHPEFAEKLGPRMTAASWHDQCVAARARVNKLFRKISLMKKKNDLKNYDFGRDPKERIGWILEMDRPLLLLQEIIKEMLADLLPESAPELIRARQYRDILLFALLCANPLRIRMFSIMKFDEHLVRLNDGSWRLQFDRGAFKNRRALKSDYEVGVAKELWPMLDRYRIEFHPLLAGPQGSQYVFVGSGHGKHRKKMGVPMHTHGLGYVIRKLTELYVPGGVWFGPHAFRHIVATDLIKKDPRIGFYLAARALHDKLETVEAEYVHLKTSEFFEPVNTHFGEAWNQVFNSPLMGSGIGTPVAM